VSYSPENFEKWNKIKQEIQFKKHSPPNFREGDVWFCHLGLNLGNEEYGKGDEFLRPILILKKFNNYLFVGVPLTTKVRNSKYYLTIKLSTWEQSLLIAQVRSLSSKRLLYRKFKFDENEFRKIKEYLKKFLF
jgi:mRNA-degrading endonuclease toxin of MazEF toxin-antitoxin module